jgi:DNA polymerase
MARAARAPGHPPASDFIPARPTLDGLRRAAQGCRACDLYARATHFKWEARGKRRIHQKPSLTEVKACLPWLEAEIALVEPRGIVCLGATAAQALMGPRFRLTREHGNLFDTRWGAWLTATFHPSVILRAPDEERRREARAQLLADLQKVAAKLRQEKLLSKRTG